MFGPLARFLAAVSAWLRTPIVRDPEDVRLELKTWCVAACKARG